MIKLAKRLAHHYSTRRGQSESAWRCLTVTEHNIFLCWLACREQRSMGDDYPWRWQKQHFEMRWNCASSTNVEVSIVIQCFQHKSPFCVYPPKQIHISGENMPSFTITQSSLSKDLRARPIASWQKVEKKCHYICSTLLCYTYYSSAFVWLTR